MNRIPLSLPEVALIAGTRAAAAAGLALLLADRLNSSQRRTIGWTLFAVGAISTIPIAIELFGSGRRDLASETASGGMTSGRSRRAAYEEQPT